MRASSPTRRKDPTSAMYSVLSCASAFDAETGTGQSDQRGDRRHVRGAETDLRVQAADERNRHGVELGFGYPAVTDLEG